MDWDSFGSGALGVPSSYLREQGFRRGCRSTERTYVRHCASVSGAERRSKPCRGGAASAGSSVYKHTRNLIRFCVRQRAPCSLGCCCSGQSVWWRRPSRQPTYRAGCPATKRWPPSSKSGSPRRHPSTASRSARPSSRREGKKGAVVCGGCVMRSTSSPSPPARRQ